MSLYFQSIGPLVPKNPKSLESGNFRKFRLLTININFQLLILVVGNKDEQLNKHLGKRPLASIRIHLSLFPVPSPITARGGGDGGWWIGTCLPLLFLLSYTVSPPLAAVPSGCTSSSVQEDDSSWVAFPPSLPVFRLVCWTTVVFSLCHFVVFTVRFFLIHLSEGARRPRHRGNLLGGLQLNARAVLCFSSAQRSRAARWMVYRKQDCFFKVCHAFKQCTCNVVWQQRVQIKQ